MIPIPPSLAYAMRDAWRNAYHGPGTPHRNAAIVPRRQLVAEVLRGAAGQKQPARVLSASFGILRREAALHSPAVLTAAAEAVELHGALLFGIGPSPLDNMIMESETWATD